MNEPGLGGDLRRGRVDLSLAQRIEEIARKDDSVPVPADEPLAGKMIDPSLEGLPHLAAEAALRQRRLVAHEELMVEPGRPAPPSLGRQG